MQFIASKWVKLRRHRRSNQPRCSQPIAKLVRIEDSPSVDHHWLSHALNEVIWGQSFEPLPLSDDDTTVGACQTRRNRVCAFERLKS